MLALNRYQIPALWRREGYLDFLLSMEGQKILPDQGRIPSRREVEPQVFSLHNVKLYASDPRLAKEYGPAGEEMWAIFGGR